MHIMLKFAVFIYLLLLFFVNLNAVNHWMVTRSGKVQAYLESPYELKEPNNLLALLDQEARKSALEKVYDDLLIRQTILQTHWKSLEKNSDETVNAKNDLNCQSAEKPFLQLDLYNNIATNGSERGILINIPNKFRPNESNEKIEDIPICRKFTDLKKLQSLVNRTNIRIEPEKSLEGKFLPINSLRHFGNYIVQSLSDNSSSWYHYNLASFYWRIKGDGNKAIDCLKLAIQFNEGYQDIPLHNLAGILHQSHHSKEAIPILKKAIEFAPNEKIHYFALGNIYAAIGDFNRSVVSYEKVLKIDSTNKEAASHRHAVLCFRTVDKGLNMLQRDVETILSYLRQYQELEQKWLEIHDDMDTSIVSYYDPLHAGSEKPRRGHRCIKKVTNGKHGITCGLHDTPPDLGEINLEKLSEIIENAKLKLNLPSLPNINLKPQQQQKKQQPQNQKHQQEQAQQDESKKQSKNQSKHNYTNSYPTTEPKYPNHMQLKRDMYFDAVNWLNKNECSKLDLNIDDINVSELTIFLPPENKGYKVKEALSDYIGVPAKEKHKLPWHSPKCAGNSVNGKRFFNVNSHNILQRKLKASSFMKSQLLNYGFTGKDPSENEIGERIMNAMAKKTAPEWVLAMVTSLYWRIRGDLEKTLDCLDMAFHNVSQKYPQDYADVVFISLGSIMLELGYPSEAIRFAELSSNCNEVEPSTNFLFALINFKNNNYLEAIDYLKRTLRIDADYYGGLAKKLLKTWECYVLLTAELETSRKPTPDITVTCPRTDELKDEPLCDKDDPDCETLTANIHCFRKTNYVLYTGSSENSNENQEMCNGIAEDPKNLGEKLIADILAAEEGAKDFLEQNNVDVNELYYSNIDDSVRMGLLLGAQHPVENLGSLSDERCATVNLHKRFKYSELWDTLKTHFIDMTSHILHRFSNPTDLRPYCMQVPNTDLPYELNTYISKILNLRGNIVQDKYLGELLQLVSGTDELTVQELGVKIASALNRNADNWEVLTAAAIYWISNGDVEQSVTCLKTVFNKVDPTMLDVPLILFSQLLSNYKLYKDALTVAHLGWSLNQRFIYNNFLMAELYIKQGLLKESIPFLHTCTQIDRTFQPAASRFLAVLCNIRKHSTKRQIEVIT